MAGLVDITGADDGPWPRGEELSMRGVAATTCGAEEPNADSPVADDADDAGDDSLVSPSSTGVAPIALANVCESTSVVAAGCTSYPSASMYAFSCVTMSERPSSRYFRTICRRRHECANAGE